MLDTDDIYEEILLNHAFYSHNYLGNLENANHSSWGSNIACGDDIIINIYSKNDVIRNISFQGNCCAVAKSSASLMTDELKGKTTDDAGKLYLKVKKVVTSQEHFNDLFQTLIKQLSFAPSEKRHHESIKCALLPWEVMLKALQAEADVNRPNINKDYSLFLE